MSLFSAFLTVGFRLGFHLLNQLPLYHLLSGIRKSVVVVFFFSLPPHSLGLCILKNSPYWCFSGVSGGRKLNVHVQSAVLACPLNMISLVERQQYIVAESVSHGTRLLGFEPWL